MSDAADFIIRLIDQATGPAKRISTALGGIHKALEHVEKNDAFKALEKASDKVWELGKHAAEAGIAVGALATGALVKATVETANWAERTELAFTRLTGGAAQGRQALATATKTAKELGLDLHETTDSFRKLLAAQFSLGQSNELVKMTADLRSIGIEGAEASRVILAITQIKAKGKLQAQEMLQLAEAGISLQLVYEALGRTTGKTRTELQKLQEAGKISADVGLAAIQDAVKHKLHESSFGEAGKAFANTTLQGMAGRLETAGQLLLVRVAKAAAPAIDALKPILKDLTDWVDNIDGSSIGDFVSTIVEGLGAAVPMVKDFFVGFGDGASELAGELRRAFGTDTGFDAKAFGHAVADGFGLAIKALGELLKIIQFLDSPTGSFLAKWTLIGLVSFKVLSGALGVVRVVSAIGPLFGLAGSALQTFGAVVNLAAGSMTGMSVTVGALAIPILAVAAAIGAVAAAWHNLSKLSSETGGLGITGTISEMWKQGTWDPFKAVDTYQNQQAKMAAQGHDVGVNLALGMAQGIQAATPEAAAAATALANATSSAARSALDQHSPSRVFEDIGHNNALGMARGHDRGAPGVQSSMVDMSAPAFTAGPMNDVSLGGARGSGAAGAGGLTVYIENHNEINGAQDPKAVAEEIRRIEISSLRGAFEQLTIELGASNAA